MEFVMNHPVPAAFFAAAVIFVAVLLIRGA